MHKKLGYAQPIGGNRQQGATQPDIVVQLYSVPTGPNDQDKANINDCSIFCSNISQNQKSDYIGVRIHLKDGVSDPKELAALALYKEIKPGEVIKFDGIKLSHGDHVRVYSAYGTTNFAIFGDEIYGLEVVEEIKKKVIAGTATLADRQKLALLTGGVYAIQTNTNNCNCP